MSISGLPLHPLVVHAAVVLTPIAALTALAYAVREGWRWLLRWPLVVTAVLAAGSLTVAKYTGQSLFNQRFATATGHLASLIHTHQQRGNWLMFLSWAFLLVAVFAAWAMGGPSALVSSAGAREARAPWATVALVLLVVAAVAMLVLVILTGDAGARAVWNPTP